MLQATLLALGAAVLHAGWNLAIKSSKEDRFMQLWAQFAVAGLLGIPIVLATGGIPARAWTWAAISGAIHLPYTVHLAHAYDRGEFSLVYPVARGGGAVLAAVGGVLLLDDRLRPLSALAIVVVGLGIVLLAGRATPHAISSALLVAVTIGGYSVADARGIRSAGTPVYALCTFVATAVTVSVHGVVTGRARALPGVVRRNGRMVVAGAIASMVTYAMVQVAFRSAPVGYVTALRESSVVLAAVVGWRRLGDTGGRRRTVAACVVLGGLIVLVLSR